MNSTPEFPRLETDRLILKKLTQDHAELILQHYSEDEINRYEDSQPARTNEDAIAIIQWGQGIFEKQAGVLWGIFLKEDDTLLGGINYVKRIDANNIAHRVEIGYDLGVKYWCKGYASESLAVVIPYIFSNSGINRIEAIIHPENTRSKKLAERFGFVEEATLREYAIKDGEYWDMVMYSLLKRDWEDMH